MMSKISVFYEHICCAAYQSGKTVEEVLALAKSWGIDCLEINYNDLKADPEGMHALLDKFGLSISCMCLDMNFAGETKEQSEMKCADAAETAHAFRCKTILCIPGLYIPGEDKDVQNRKFLDGLGTMCKAGAKYGITVTIEDYDNSLSPCVNIVGMKYLSDKIEGLKITFDTGNFLYSGDDTDAAYEKFKDKIVHCHLKDRSARPTDLCAKQLDASGNAMYTTVVGEGEMEIGRRIKRMLSDGYTGAFVIEHFGLDDRLTAIQRSAEYVKNVIG